MTSQSTTSHTSQHKRPHKGLKCPKCGNITSKVKYTRKVVGGTIRRRRECLACPSRFTTEERIVNKRLDQLKR